jgi:2-polyprenyl-6-methoxyphenol hydroxylase-like FAD-dependent oxidoreductase
VKYRTGCAVDAAIWEKGRLQGVRFTNDGTFNSLSADLIVDAGGRGSCAPRWLTEQGFPVPAETIIGVDLAYGSTKYHIPGYHGEPERILGFFSIPPHSANGGFFAEIENDIWGVSLFGRFGEFPPVEEAGFLAFAKSLPAPRLYEIIKDAERVTDIVQYRYPTSVKRHYERLAAFPEGFLVLGDAICSFNPVYGQGTSSAALQVKALQNLLTERAEASHGLAGLAPAFFPKAAEVIATPGHSLPPLTSLIQRPQVSVRPTPRTVLATLLRWTHSQQRTRKYIDLYSKCLDFLSRCPLFRRSPCATASLGDSANRKRLST